MVALISQAGTAVEVGDELAETLTRKGWVAAKPVVDEVKRSPGRPKKDASKSDD